MKETIIVIAVIILYAYGCLIFNYLAWKESVWAEIPVALISIIMTVSIMQAIERNVKK